MEDAAKILSDIKANKWGWLKVNKLQEVGPKFITAAYMDLYAHHVEETERMIEVIKDLCVQIVEMGDFSSSEKEAILK